MTYIPPSNLLQKYNVAVPRYTSYPTVPHWQDHPPARADWKARVRRAVESQSNIAVYAHLPFCERLCTYCGCNTRITRNHGVEDPYIDTLLEEWKLYLDAMETTPTVREIHLGGGTPTFFQPRNLDRFLRRMLLHIPVSEDHEFGLEVHPATCTKDHLIYLRINGFQRISVGVQDFSESLLKVINRFQTPEEVAQVTKWARQLGYRSVNFDLIYGLPKQTLDHIEATMKRVGELRPDRIAFYSYAHVPWLKNGQRAYSEADLPTGAEKLALYERGRALLEYMGYVEIGLDHFALPDDRLTRAAKSGTLHRNFMGYTPHQTRMTVGLGASAISDSWDGYVQNEKSVEAYTARVAAGVLPYFRGHLLSEQEQSVRRHILNIMCKGFTSWTVEQELFERARGRWQQMAYDGLLTLGPRTVTVTERGKPFLRNIAAALDPLFDGGLTHETRPMFSRSV